MIFIIILNLQKFTTKKIIVHLTNNIFHTYYLKLNFEMQFEYSTRVMVEKYLYDSERNQYVVMSRLVCVAGDKAIMHRYNL